MTVSAIPGATRQRPSGIPSAPPAEAFAVWPASWYCFAQSGELDRGPVTRDLLGRRLVGYRTSRGRAVILDARCWHLGADLGGGQIVDDCLQCPFHGWRFDESGSCSHIPAQQGIPAAARQRRYETAERSGQVWVFAAPEAPFQLPFFEGVEPAELVGAPPFEFRLSCPWWLVGTNGFDLQHFAGAHDRRLVAAPEVSTPHPAARRIVAEFDVSGSSWRDCLTRLVSGPRVRMDVTIWGGTLAFVAATFLSKQRRAAWTTSYGMVEIRPLTESSPGLNTLVRVRIFVRRHRGRRVPAWVDARVRRQFIRMFLHSDAQLLSNLRYDPDRLIEADRVMIDYLRWLAPVSHGHLTPEDSQ